MKESSKSRLLHSAFTILELIFVIVVIGILAASIIPSTKTNPLREAAIQLLSDIRYTQHLAMIDDKYNSNDAEWYKGRWQIVFSNNVKTNNQEAYTIFSDTPGYSGDPSVTEIAKNPQNDNLLMSGGYTGTVKLDVNHNSFIGMKKLNIGMSYGIDDISLDGGCSYSRISFDHLGRPFTGDQKTMTGPYSAGTQRLITSVCNITISSEIDSITITIEPETGYAKINF